MIQKLQTTNNLTGQQWAVVGAVAVAAAPAGPIVMAVATIGAAGGCYVSNAMGGWKGDPGPASHS